MDTTLVCEVGNAEDPFDSADEWEANADTIIACVNAFHSEDGREIPTEAITEGLFWEVVELLKDARAMMDDRVEDWEVRGIRDFLAKLEPPK